MHRFKNMDFPFADQVFKDIIAAVRTVYDGDWAAEVQEDPAAEEAEAEAPTQLMKSKTSVAAFMSGASVGRDEHAQPRATVVRDELDVYLSLPKEMDMDCDVLLWWRKHESAFPTVALMARQFLGAPATSAAAERVFSRAGRFHDDYKKSCKEETIRDALLVATNM